MTTIYFIKTEYTGNIYKVSDFYNSNGTFLKPVNRSMAVDMRFNDGQTILDTQIKKLPDGTDLHDYTHIIVPDKQKVYTITAIDDLNIDSYKLYLEDEPLMGNYQEFKDVDMIITRTTDYKQNWFQGVTDITDMSYDYTADVTRKSTLFSGSRMWLAVWVQPPDETTVYDNIKIETSPITGDLSADSFDTLLGIRSTYPEYTFNVSSNNYNLPTDLLIKLNETDYVNKVVYNRANSTYYTYIPILYTNIWQWKLGWHVLENNNTLTLPGYTFGNNFLNNSPDIRTMILLFPLSTALYYNNAKLISGRNFKQVTYIKDDVSSAASVLAVKLIPESIMASSGINGSILSSNSEQNLGWWNVSSNSSIGAFYNYFPPENLQLTTGVAYLKSTKSEIDLSLNANMGSIYNIEPFKHYELWIYGQKFDVPSYFVNNMRMVTNLTTDGITFNLYRDAEKTKLFASGTANFDSKWSIDKLDLYAQNNPTYKDEFNNKMQQRWAQTFVGGSAGVAAAGATMGLPGLALGAVGVATAAVSTTISNNFDRKQFEVMQRNKQMQPDQIFGNSAAASLIQKIRNGIYWVTKTGNNQSQMINEYERKGYPTYMKRSIMDITPIWNSLVEANARVLTGYFIDTIKNNYVTNEINKKLSEGVILVS